MAFYQESIDLGLKKNFTQFQYDEISDEMNQKQIYSISEQQLTLQQEGKQILLEKSILFKDIQNLCAYFLSGEIRKDFPFDKIKNRVCHIFEKYQEQSSLLDSILEHVVTPLMAVIKHYIHSTVQAHLRDPTQPLTASGEFYALTDTLYIASKVSGVRSISRFFPHEVKDIEPVVYFLQHTQGGTHWEARYVMLLWLSVIILAPFDLATIDSNLFSQVGAHLTNDRYKGSIVLCLVNLGIGYLNSSTKVRNASALFLSKLFSRPDVLSMGLLGDFFTWAIEKISQLQVDVGSAFYVTGILEALVEVLKIVQRDQLKPHLARLVAGLPLGGTSATINLFLAKLTQRAGLVYLRPRVVAWTYKKGNRNLADTSVDHSKVVTNVQVKKTTATTSSSTFKEESLLKVAAEDYFADVDQEALEIIIDNLLVMLTNKDTIVRWSAAKGIGRICGRLELDQANDVLSALVEVCFNPIQTDTAWHGGCLALGELCRRGLILESRLPQVVPIIIRALVFEQNQGGYSTGTNVRDSACYIAWSAARAYDPSTLVPYILELSRQLAVVMIFDREVNVRRAASSTFQELVGRCPNIIPHGISIVSECDYFSLALRHNAYLKIAPYVASFEEYYEHMVNHLAFTKVQSQDREIRKLTARSLARLIQIKPAYFFENNILQRLLNLLKVNNFNGRHGALCAIGDILVGLTGKFQGNWDDKELKDSVFLRTLTQNEKQLTKAGEYLSQFKDQYKQQLKEDNLFMIPPEIIAQILEAPFFIEQEKLLRGKAGEQIRIALCRYLECVSIAKLEVTPKQYKLYLNLVDEGLKNPLEEVQEASVRALTSLSRNFDEGEFLREGQGFVRQILEQLKGKTTFTSGFTQAIGAFSGNVVFPMLEQIIDCLSHIGVSKRSSAVNVVSLDPDTRKFAIRSLGESVSVVLQSQEIPEALLKKALKNLLRSFSDYTMNKRGDVGLYIRENAIVGIQKVLQSFVKHGRSKCFSLEKELVEEIVGSLLQQMNEKIDRVLQDLMKNVVPVLTEFDNRNELLEVLSAENLQKAMLEDQERVDQTFQQDVIEAEIKILKERLLNISKSELVYHWNLPHCCFRQIVPLMRFDNFTFYIVFALIYPSDKIKGLCISVGGISESIQKYSEEALSKYILEHQDKLEHLMDQILKLMTTHQNDERLITPLFKTLNIILEKDEFQQWDKVEHYTTLLYHATMKEIEKSDSINKVVQWSIFSQQISASVPIILNILHLNNNLVKECLLKAKEFLLHLQRQNTFKNCERFPKIRKLTADKLYLVLLSLDCEEALTSENSSALQDFLLETDWLNEKLDLAVCRQQLETFLT